MRESYVPERRRKERYPISLWDSNVDRMFQEMSRMFDELFAPTTLKCMTGIPTIDFYRRDGKVIAEIELPGIDPHNVDIKVYRDRLILNAVKNQESDYEEDLFLCSERYFGNVSRVVKFPVDVNPDSARASYHNGVLRLEVDEIEGPEAGRTLEIEVED